MNEKRVENFIREWYPRRHLTRGDIGLTPKNFKPNWYWVKRAIRVLKVHRRYQRWVAFGDTCAAPGSYDPAHLTETLDRFIQVMDDLNYA